MGLSHNFSYSWAFWCLAISAGLSLGCAEQEKSPPPDYNCNKRASTIYNAQPEASVCTTTTSYTGGVTISGNAIFQKRAYAESNGLAAGFTNTNIRHAEFVVYAENGSVMQCGNVSSTGTFSFAMPLAASNTYTLRINTRGDNSVIKASVLNCPEENKPYYIETSFTPDSTKSIGTITADSANDGPLIGGAFNIYDQLVRSNLFLQEELGNCSASHAGCTDVNIPPKSQTYWVKGFTPNAYFGSDSPISFYIPKYRRLFILGGVNGDILTSDTDHFDDSVIIHEYGHFLEDAYTVTDSPGGPHAGNSIIDPRLAWGEGWGNFIQAAIRNEGSYRDTRGTPGAGGTASYIFNIPLEEPIGSCAVGSSASGCDIPEFNGEGVFREFSISRMLWDVFDSSGAGNDTDGDSVQRELHDLWAAMTRTIGLKNPLAAFRNIGFLHYVQDQLLTGSSDWSSLRTEHKHTNDSSLYAQYAVETPGGCGKVFSLDPYDDPSDDGTFARSHRLRNNNFYHFYNPSARNVTLRLVAASVTPGTQEPDLDLYLYNKKARYGVASDIIKSSDNYWDNNSNTEQIETLSTSLARGHYLINTKVFTGRISVNSCFGTCPGNVSNPPTCLCQNDEVPAGDPINYQLRVNGVDLCPTEIP